MGAEIKGTTDISLSHVGGAYMNLEISWLGELLIAANMCARYFLSLLQGLPRMLAVDVIL